MTGKTSQRSLLSLLLVCCMLCLSNLGIVAQNTSYKGKVIDATIKEPLIGVSILEKGTANGVITDIDGNFNIQTSPEAVLVFSYIGYTTVEKKAAECNGITIKLAEDSEMLQEVVVVGYGVQKKVNLSGSVSAIDGEQIAAKPSTDVLSALQGEMPGVAITRSSGQPGSKAGLQVRGATSVNSTETLVLIDGVEGDMSLLNADDIASISVLKDAASCAIYGARAAAGVVLVTTKNGNEGKPKVSYNGYVSFNLPGNMPERIPAWEEQTFINESRIQSRGSAEWNAEKTSWVGNPNFNYRPLNNGRWDLFDSVDWLGEGTKNFALQHNHSVSASGGSDKMNYLFSANYFYKNGLLQYGPDDYNRYNLLAKVNASINKHIDLSINVQYQSDEQAESAWGSTDIFNLLFTNRGRQSIYQPEQENYKSPYNGDLQDNPIDLMQNGGEKRSKYESYMGKAQLTIKDLVKNLRINLSASRRGGYYSRNTNERTLNWYNYLGEVRRTANAANSLYKEKNSSYHDVLEATANYSFSLDDAQHNFNVLAGSSYENYRMDKINATAKNMLSNDFFSFNYYNTSEATNTVLGDYIGTWAMMSYFGRINYNYKEKYLLEANVRYDGSSRLAPDKRWRAFPSVSAAWRVSEEEWFKDIKWLSSLKLRASWGQLGNGAVVGLYDYLPLISHSQDNIPTTYQGEKWFYQSSMASKDKTWEIIETTNLGVDFGFLNNRLTGSFEYYWKYNNEMLSDLQLPSQIGIKVPKMNVGKLKTWGWDFNINWKDQIKDFSYQIGFNVSDSKNELIKYDGASVVKAGVVGLLEGHPINTIWGYKTDGFWSSREEYIKYKEEHPGFSSFNDNIISGGDVKYVAQGKPDHQIGVGGGTPENSGDLVCLGNTTPRYFYGINLSAQWKGFDFTAIFQGVGKRDVMLSGDMFPMYRDEQMPWTIHRNHWTEENQNAYWPRLYQYKGENFNSKAADRWLQDASYLRLKNLTLGYTIPVSKKYMEKLRVYVTGQDLFEITDMLSVLDPETENNVSRSLYPFFRSWTVGVNVTF
ncbi:TonB-dependent receptor [Bacteroides sp.]|uniref:SusC/RagA family TonB-linked outer membrane protein n=1 Tax=Bacteroides sp. TaxID=29523 RepID=UPI0026393EA3|nr:TonB-dependent receptor [Bacteroides sp.]